MRWHSKFVAFVVLGIAMLGAPPLHAQKVKYSFDKSVDFQHYKRYAWGQNYLLTHQRPDDQKVIGESLKASINRQLAAKGFILDEARPDFIVSYEAGGMTKAALSHVPDLSRVGPDPNAIDQPAFGLPMNSTDAWVSVLGGLRVTIDDATTKKHVWIGQISDKIKDPQKFMLNVDSRVDAATAKLMKPFPPPSGVK